MQSLDSTARSASFPTSSEPRTLSSNEKHAAHRVQAARSALPGSLPRTPEQMGRRTHRSPSESSAPPGAPLTNTARENGESGSALVVLEVSGAEGAGARYRGSAEASVQGRRALGEFAAPGELLAFAQSGRRLCHARETASICTLAFDRRIRGRDDPRRTRANPRVARVGRACGILLEPRGHSQRRRAREAPWIC
jgi:hypothetical protein